MTLKNLRIFTATFFLIGTTTQTTQCMHAFKSKLGAIGWKAVAGKTLAGALTIGSFASSAAPVWYLNNSFTAIKNLHNGTWDKELDAQADVDEECKKSVCDILRKKNFTEQDLSKLKIKKFFGFFTASTFNNHYLLIPAITKINPENKAEYAKFVGSVQHESHHLENKDSLKKIGLSLALPFITQCTCLALRRILPIQITNPILKNCLKIPGGIAKGYGNVLLFFAYCRNMEQQADNAIENNPEILDACITDYEQKLQWERHMLEHMHMTSDNTIINTFYKLGEKLCKWELEGNLPFFLNIFDHPATPHRINKFKERKKALEEKDDQKALENPLETKEQEVVK